MNLSTFPPGTRLRRSPFLRHQSHFDNTTELSDATSIMSAGKYTASVFLPFYPSTTSSLAQLVEESYTRQNEKPFFQIHRYFRHHIMPRELPCQTRYSGWGLKLLATGGLRIRTVTTF